MTQKIHPTACIASGAKLGENVTVGPFAVIEDDVSIGNNSGIGSHCVVQRYVKMGEGNVLHPHVVLGDIPQDTSFDAGNVSWLEIGDRNTFREGFTAHRAAVIDGATTIGSDCFFMNNSHVAHDCTVGNHTVFANNVAIGGVVEVGDNVFIGGAAVVHQFCRVGSYAIIRGTTGVSKDVIPFMLIGGFPVKHYRLNVIGLRRAGITGQRYKVLSQAFRLLKKRAGLEDLEQTEELLYLNEWLAADSKRGLHGFVDIKKAAE
jgi:UDP-N-acetylglucosamine acyltransferase